AGGFQQMLEFDQATRDSVTLSILKNVMTEKTHLLSLWLHWELNKVEKEFLLGRVRHNYYRINNIINYKIDTVEREGDNVKGLYYAIKSSGKQVITEPYLYSYSKLAEDEILEASICSPIITKGNFVGLMGIDIALTTFDKQINKITPFEGAYAMFVSNDGTFISHPNTKNIGRNIIEDSKELDEKYSFGNDIKSGKPTSFYRKNARGDMDYVSFAPVFVGDIETPWSLGIVVPQKVILAKGRVVYQMAFIIGFSGLLILVLLVYWLANQISTPLVSLSKVIGELALGEIDREDDFSLNRKDEIGQISDSVVQLTEGMFRMSEFAAEIGRGNLDIEYQLLGDNDILGLSLIEMQKNLKNAKDEETKRRDAEEIQNWISKGLALTNEILRKQGLNIQQHTYEALKIIVDYIEANQGVLFIGREVEDEYDDEDEKIEFFAVAAQAWGRKRSIKKAYKMGESLVGRCAFEQSTIYMTKIPQDYVNITSGLGKSNPHILLLVPLLMNDTVLGVLEIASFTPLKTHEIEFIEKASYSLASTIAGKQVNERTAKLLEQTKLQAEELVQKEEEMRQNIEEMQATQEDFAQREAEIDSYIGGINNLAKVMHFDMSGNIIYVNENFAEFLGFSPFQIIGKTFNAPELNIQESSEMNSSELWNRMFAAETIKIKRRYMGKTLTEVYSPVLSRDGVPVKVICIAVENEG
ncbi:MAG: cache domain-containing protein, partial [Salinivirgaceae bacterium]|nr:cache domain-containing protein [Salinivirgaceae bacterium]